MCCAFNGTSHSGRVTRCPYKAEVKVGRGGTSSIYESSNILVVLASCDFHVIGPRMALSKQPFGNDEEMKKLERMVVRSWP